MADELKSNARKVGPRSARKSDDAQPAPTQDSATQAAPEPEAAPADGNEARTAGPKAGRRPPAEDAKS
jgi:hypothetical protein